MTHAIIRMTIEHYDQQVKLEYILYRAIYGEGNGTPLQYPCLENPMDGGAW